MQQSAFELTQQAVFYLSLVGRSKAEQERWVQECWFCEPMEAFGKKAAVLKQILARDLISRSAIAIVLNERGECLLAWVRSLPVLRHRKAPFRPT